jgi:tetratricopeptide (TPR) repeat protein
MKKITLLLVALFASTLAFPQNTKVVSTFNYLRNGQLEKAKSNIDDASINDQTKGVAKTWFYRGNTYLGIYLSKEPKYKALDSNALQVAYDSYQKALEIDPKVDNDGVIPSSPIIGILIIGEQFYNQGVDLYNKKDFTNALDKFEKTKKINSIFGSKDSTATFNAALCAIQLKDNKKAKSYLEDLTKLNYKQPVVYTQLANIYKSEGDTNKAAITIGKARKLFPSDLNLIISEINIYLAKGKTKEAQDLLDLAVSKDPNNPTLHFAIGANMDEFGNFDQAEKSYLKAIELKPDYFDAYYNLGALYVNTAATLMDQANKLPITETQKYDELKGKADKMLEKALPALETAMKLNPNDFNTLVTLKQLYARKGDAAKIAEIDAKIKTLKH